MLANTPTRYMFFIGKGVVGKSAVACSSSITLADAGRRVLLITTDPASNLDEMIETTVGPVPMPIAGVPDLFAMNLEPTTAAARGPGKDRTWHRSLLPEEYVQGGTTRPRGSNGASTHDQCRRA